MEHALSGDIILSCGDHSNEVLFHAKTKDGMRNKTIKRKGFFINMNIKI